MASSFALPLPESMRTAMRGRGLRRAAHFAAVFGVSGDVASEADWGRLRTALAKVLGDEVPEQEVFEEWLHALAEFLPQAEAWEKDDVERLLEVGPVLRERALREQAEAVMAVAPPTIEEAQVDLLWAAPPAKRWRTSRVLKRSAPEAGPDARARTEREEHRRWAEAAVDIVIELDAPVVFDASGATRSRSLLANLFAGRRASTLRARVRVYRKFLAWLRLRPTATLRYTSSDVISYLLSFADVDTGMSVPRAVVYAVGFMEKHAGWPEASRSCADPLVLGTAEMLEQRFAAHSAGRGEARRYPALVIIALELTVLDVKAAMVVRLVAGYILVKVWACMRYDDTRAVDPARVRDLGSYYALPMARTKTSGSSGRVRQESFLLKEAGLSGEIWAPTFMAMVVEVLPHTRGATCFHFQRRVGMPLSRGWLSTRTQRPCPGRCWMACGGRRR